MECMSDGRYETLELIQTKIHEKSWNFTNSNRTHSLPYLGCNSHIGNSVHLDTGCLHTLFLSLTPMELRKFVLSVNMRPQIAIKEGRLRLDIDQTRKTNRRRSEGLWCLGWGQRTWPTLTNDSHPIVNCAVTGDTIKTTFGATSDEKNCRHDQLTPLSFQRMGAGMYGILSK